MEAKGWIRSATATGIVFFVSACGGGGSSGGGVISTPPPAPAPTPTPPPPAPPPTTANADLTSLTQSESFTNDSRTGTASYPKAAGAFSASVSANALTIVYDAPSQTYTVTSGSRSQSFAPSNVDAASSSPQLIVYKRTSGTTTDTLTLTRPGTSGSLTYKYVGGGFWQRTIDGASTINGEFDAIAYGVETPDSAVVRTGGANYNTSLLGVVARPDALYSLAGEATLGVNFLSGAISGRSLSNGAREVRADTLTPGRQGDWSFSGTLASAANAITGTMTLYPAFSDPLTGSASGRLYGPSSDEIGIVFQASEGDGSRAVGTILGRKSSTPFNGSNPSLVALQFDETFTRLAPGSGSISWSASDSAGKPSVFSSSYSLQPFTPDLKYTNASQTYALVDTTSTVISTSGTANAALTSSKFLGYSNSSADSVARLRMYRVGSSNSEIALTYSSYYNLEHASQLVGTSSWFFKSFWTPFGITTPNTAMPTSGSAAYSGFINGSAIDGNIGDTLASVSGTIGISVNFVTAVVTGNIHPTITYQGGSQYDLGSLSLFDGRYYNPGVNQSGVSGPPNIAAVFGYQRSFGTGPTGPLHNGTVAGTFFGPVGQELTGQFGAEYAPQGASGISGRMWGAFGTKGP